MLNLKSTVSTDKLTPQIESILNQTLGRLISAYNLLNVHQFKSVLDNIMYYGLKEMQNKVLKKEKRDICE